MTDDQVEDLINAFASTDQFLAQLGTMREKLLDYKHRRLRDDLNMNLSLGFTSTLFSQIYSSITYNLENDLYND